MVRQIELTGDFVEKYSRVFGKLLVTDGDKRKRSYWVGDIDRLEAWKEGRFNSFFWGGGHTAFAETQKVMLLGTDHHGGTNSIVCLRSSGDSSASQQRKPSKAANSENSKANSRNQWIRYA